MRLEKIEGRLFAVAFERAGSIHQWICVQLFAWASASYAPIVKVLGRNSNTTLVSVSKSYSRVVAYIKVLGVAHSGWKRSFADPKNNNTDGQ